MRRNGEPSAVRSADSPQTPFIYLPNGSIAHFGKANGNGNGRAADCVTEERQVQHVDFRAFPDGTKLELVQDPHSGGVQFLVWSGGSWSVAPHFSDGSTKYLPPEIDRSILEQLSLPSKARASSDPTDIIYRLTSALREFVDLDEENARLASTYGLYTWVFDRYHVAPYLWITGGPGSGKTTLLRFLRCICRRGLVVSDCSPASLYSIPTLIRPTLMLDEYDTGASRRSTDIARILRAGSTAGEVVSRSARVYDVFCPKVIASSELPPDSALKSRSIVIGLFPSNRNLRSLDQEAVDDLLDEFQPELLMFRLGNLDRVRANLDLSLPSPRTSDIVRALSLPLLGNTTLDARLVQALGDHADEVAVDRTFEPDALVVRALMWVAHHNRGDMTCSALGVIVADLAEELGEHFNIGPRKVGEILRIKCRIPTQPLGRLGRGIELTRGVRRQIHALAQRYGVTKADLLNSLAVKSGYGGAPCALCKEFGLMVREPGGQPLKVVPLPKPRPRRGSLFEQLEDPKPINNP